MSNIKIIKPIAKYANMNGNFPIPTTIKPLAVAGTTLKEGSVIYLLHQLPYNFLLTDFYDHNLHYNKIPVRIIKTNEFVLITDSIYRFIVGIKI